jgi:hypothetical protein
LSWALSRPNPTSAPVSPTTRNGAFSTPRPPPAATDAVGGAAARSDHVIERRERRHCGRRGCMITRRIGIIADRERPHVAA